MKMRGFTLVELLAVIVILSLLALLTGTAITKILKDSKDELSDTQIQLIKSAAETWGADNIGLLPSSGNCKYLTLGDLKEYGLMDSSVIDARNNEEFSDDLTVIKITTNSNPNGLDYTVYEVNVDVTGCTSVY